MVREYVENDARVRRGYSQTDNDCGVVAAVLCTGLPYEEVNRELIARKIRKGARRGCRMLPLRQWIFEKLGVPMPPLNHTVSRVRTPKTFAQAHPKGKFLLSCAGHAVVIENGVILNPTTVYQRIRNWVEIPERQV